MEREAEAPQAAAAETGPPTDPQAHITVRNLTMAFGSFVLMRDLTFTVKRGDVFVIMGGSGCGKSTLLRHLIGLIEPARGRDLVRPRELHAARSPRRGRRCCGASACCTRAARCGAR